MLSQVTFDFFPQCRLSGCLGMLQTRFPVRVCACYGKPSFSPEVPCPFCCCGAPTWEVESVCVCYVVLLRQVSPPPQNQHTTTPPPPPPFLLPRLRVHYTLRVFAAALLKSQMSTRFYKCATLVTCFTLIRMLKCMVKCVINLYTLSGNTDL